MDINTFINTQVFVMPIQIPITKIKGTEQKLDHRVTERQLVSPYFDAEAEQ